MIDNLLERNVWILDWCYMCKSNGKTVDHLLLHCHIATDFWSMVFGLFVVYWLMPETLIDLLACWQGRLGNIAMVLFGWLSHIVWCSVFRGKWITRPLITLRGPYQILKFFFLKKFVGLDVSCRKIFSMFGFWFDES